MTAPSRAPRPAEHPDDGMLDADRSAYENLPGRVAPDGQRIVDQSGEVADEQREIERNAERLMTASRDEGAREPSVRFWHSRRALAGPMLALLAGVFTLAIRTWPIATPQGRGSVGIGWETGAIIAGLLYVAGFLLADRHWKRARLVLICGALLHLLFGVLAATLVDAQEVAPAWQSLLFDAVPAVAALLAAFLITAPPGQRHE